MKPRVIIVMGVSGSGKTTIGEAIALEKKMNFVDGDDLHPQANIDKMSAGKPLTDEDREAWFDEIIIKANLLIANGESVVLACSALKKKYRDKLRKGIANLSFVHLKISYQKVYEQMVRRKGHFMPIALLKSQFDILEEPVFEENVFTVDVIGGVLDTVSKVLSMTQ